MERGGVTLKSPRLVQKGDQLLVLYDGQITSRLDLEFRAVNSEKDGVAFKRLRNVTNFHSLAKDMEQERMNHSDTEKAVLLEKTNHMDEPNRCEESLADLEFKSGVWRKVKAELSEHKLSAFKQVYRTSGLHGTGGTWINLMGSAFSPVPARLGNKTNILFKSSKSLATPSFIKDSIDSTKVKGDHAQNDLLMSYNFLALANSFLPTADVWPKSEVSKPPPVLPPTFTTLVSTAQIWCAKCKLSFRMTSDLVLHMRSRHKKDAGSAILGKRQRELQLSCPVCYAQFRERHHLSRHMISHC